MSTRIVELIGDAGAHVADMQKLLDFNERVIEEQRVECIRASQTVAREKAYSTKVEEKNSELVQAVIHLTMQLDEAHELARVLRDESTTTQPRRAVGAA